ncbi:MAG: hypothetical protein PHP97_04360 [Candidatus Shapirobacteria bacterium]|nr:hypothetical protein [Candidatus Shapirobacteria bacterium]MDD4383274.1 hypothetical protein [Candidatus Shapirobacteria bacterium]
MILEILVFENRKECLGMEKDKKVLIIGVLAMALIAGLIAAYVLHIGHNPIFKYL